MRSKVIFNSAVVIGLLLSRAAFAASCAAGFTGTNPCYPILPSSDFSTTANYPSCGVGRVAVSGDGNYTLNTASYSVSPLSGSGSTYTDDSGNVYNYLTSSSSPPNFIIPPDARCVCYQPGTSVPGTNASPISNYSNTLGSGASRFYPDTADIISSQTFQNQVTYAPVAADKDSSKDGRLGTEYGSQSSCACPNVNEILVSNGTDGANPVGMNCQPAITTPNYRVLTPYNPQIHTGTQILNPGNEPTDLSGTILSSITLPNSLSDQIGTTSYARKIWTCATPYEPSTSGCQYTAATASKHQCDSTSDMPNNADFNLVVNKKLACCMNAFNPTLPNSETYEKFDCIDNSISASTAAIPYGTPFADFNALWASSDSTAQGGQLNAIVLVSGASGSYGGPAGKVISGFYSLNGTHCDQFSEFAFPTGAGITSYRVDPMIKSTQQQTVGNTPVAIGTIPLPSSAAYSILNAGVTGAGKTYPQALKDYQQCPILVRAAMVASCPSPVSVPNALTTITDPVDNSIRCPVAGSIQIHVKIEQIYQITGQAPLSPIDTILNPGQTSAIDISSLIIQKYGNQCPPGLTSQNGICSY